MSKGIYDFRFAICDWVSRRSHDGSQLDAPRPNGSTRSSVSIPPSLICPVPTGRLIGLLDGSEFQDESIA
jgi:hypothetical protein